MSKPKILFYDIETTPLQAWVWRCGKQVVRHGQLVKGKSKYDIICITYCWNDGKPAKHFDWGYEEQDSSSMITKFDELVHQSDLTIGKNSDSFDTKHINTQRMLAGLPGLPDWTSYTDDLQKQMKRHFYLPSYSLDYFSELLGYGGKIRMEFSDWIHIIEKTPKEGLIRFKKMIEYGKKDVEDTRAIWDHCAAHFTPKFNASTIKNEHACKLCGSFNISKNGTRILGTTRYQRFHCNDHGGYAGKATISRKGVLGDIR